MSQVSIAVHSSLRSFPREILFSSCRYVPFTNPARLQFTAPRSCVPIYALMFGDYSLPMLVDNPDGQWFYAKFTCFIAQGNRTINSVLIFAYLHLLALVLQEIMSENRKMATMGGRPRVNFGDFAMW
ncbi:hypothetical protein Gmet_3629 [Geobacter metallireducens GS-15]|uniref:Uncharacterized protein n=1 Tax=Geobacter metallireducens (strain ATCC 53774 / DSM 7210 / GS-15) TaxID=269799 RepID=J7LWD9_GEOMG|nr:hypothetical protein Gmet_3629 [Geobacter metallireducens GS-15]